MVLGLVILLVLLIVVAAMDRGPDHKDGGGGDIKPIDPNKPVGPDYKVNPYVFESTTMHG